MPAPNTTAPSAARIEARDWSYTYPRRDQPAVRSATFTVQPGELVVLMGASGSGKSTLLRAIAGLLPDGGSGRLTVTYPGEATSGLVQQEPDANIVMELLGDDVAFPLENRAVPPEAIWPAVDVALRRVGLELPRNRQTQGLSGGQQQLLGLAAASAADPGLLLLDEPTANLDNEAAARVAGAVAELRRDLGCTVVVIEHRIEAWLPSADRVLVVAHGVVTAVRPGQLGSYLDDRPNVAQRVWIDRRRLPRLAPGRSISPENDIVVVEGVGVDNRLAPVSLTAGRGEVVALTGPPGSGKSTLLMCLAGLMRPSQGVVQVAGRSHPHRWPARVVAATFGVVFQNPEHQFVTSRVLDELSHGLLVAGADAGEAATAARSRLDRLGLAHLADADPFTLSGGEQRRLGVGTALILEPRVLVLDEPTFGQDPATWTEIATLIAEQRDAGGTVIMATHDQDLVQALQAREVPLTPVPAPRDDRPPRLRGLRGLEPLALFGSAALLSLAALASTSVAFNLALAAFAIAAGALGGLPGKRLALLAVPALVACASVALSNALLGGGITSAAAWQAAALPASRVLAVALPGLIAAVAIDPTALADSLVVRLGVSARGAYAVLAGFRLLPLLAQEWETLERANRARGLGGGGPVGRIRLFGSLALRLLVAALRRGQRLAVALDARGLCAGDRTVARPRTWTAVDTTALATGAAWLVAAVVAR